MAHPIPFFVILVLATLAIIVIASVLAVIPYLMLGAAGYIYSKIKKPRPTNYIMASEDIEKKLWHEEHSSHAEHFESPSEQKRRAS